MVPAGSREPHRAQPELRGRFALPRRAPHAAPAPVPNPGAPPSTSRGGAGPAGGGGRSARPSRGGAAQERP